MVFIVRIIKESLLMLKKVFYITVVFVIAYFVGEMLGGLYRGIGLEAFLGVLLLWLGGFLIGFSVTKL